MSEFHGKVAVITGGVSGIGFATAAWFIERGASVVLADLDDERGAKAAADLDPQGQRATFIATDITQPEQVKKLFEAVKARHGRLDALINSAGIHGPLSSLDELPLESWHQLIAVNLHGSFYAMHYAIPLMLESGGGAVVNVASMMGQIAHPHIPGYVASKHGVVGLTKSAALNYADRGIRVNAVGPGVVKTPMTKIVTDNQESNAQMLAASPMKRLGEPPELAGVIGFLCSEAASFVTGSYYLADGGFTIQ